MHKPRLRAGGIRPSGPPLARRDSPHSYQRGSINAPSPRARRVVAPHRRLPQLQASVQRAADQRARRARQQLAVGVAHGCPRRLPASPLPCAAAARRAPRRRLRRGPDPLQAPNAPDRLASARHRPARKPRAASLSHVARWSARQQIRNGGWWPLGGPTGRQTSPALLRRFQPSRLISPHCSAAQIALGLRWAYMGGASWWC